MFLPSMKPTSRDKKPHTLSEHKQLLPHSPFKKDQLLPNSPYKKDHSNTSYEL